MSETLAACLTPPGIGAIAVIGVRGLEALRVMGELFHSGRERETAKRGFGALEPGKVYLGKFGGGDAQDDVVLLVKQVDPVPWFELHCHGGREVVRMILEALEGHGIRRCSWEEWERRTAASPLQAEAAIQLAQARTVRTAGILLDQYQGAFDKEIAAIRAALDRDDLAAARQRLQVLAERIPLGRHLTRPWRVVIAGAPNVGKSSLVNALAGYERSIVAATPGTTRDVVTTALAVVGWPIELVDTAGLRPAAGELEAAGIRLAQETAAAADLALWVLDGSAVPVWPEGPQDRMLIINKIDLPPAWDFGQAPGALAISALTGQGIAELGRIMASRLVPVPPPPGAGVPFTDHLGNQVARALECLKAGDITACRRLLS